MATSTANGSSASLIAEARAGSPNALSALYLEHGVALFRVALMRLRSGKRRREVGLHNAAGRAEPHETAERDGLQAAVDTLPDHLRAVLVLKEIEGYAHAEIAELLGISEGASRVRLTRALKKLRRELESGR